MNASYRHLLVPLDGSATAGRGLAEALELARGLGAKVRVLHVLDPRLLLGHAGEASGEQLAAAQRAEGRRVLDDALVAAGRAGVDAEAVLREAAPQRVADVILHETHAWPADLVVMGTHGRSGIGRVALGSDADAVLRGSAVPVLLVRAQA